MSSKFGYVLSEIEELGGSVPDTLKLYVESYPFGQWDMMVEKQWVVICFPWSCA